MHPHNRSSRYDDRPLRHFNTMSYSFDELLTAGGKFAKFPSNMENIALDAAGLVGYTADHPWTGIEWAVPRAGGGVKIVNVANLLASNILGEDVTGDDFEILVGEDGLIVMRSTDMTSRSSSNSRAGPSPNVSRKNPVTIHIKNEDGTVTSTTYESEREASRATGIPRSATRRNRKLNTRSG